MEDLKREIKLIKNMIHFHSVSGNKGLKKKFLVTEAMFGRIIFFSLIGLATLNVINPRLKYITVGVRNVL